ncbi:MAG: DUF2441 domain-containing protein [Candidatus Binatia bacterium]
MRFFHYTTKDVPENLIGVESFTGWDVNHYWQQKLDGAWIQEVDKQTAPVIETIFRVAPREVAERITELLKSLNNAGKYAAELLKEYVFEEVRAARFTSCPSRRKCLFLFESTDPERYIRSIGSDPRLYNVVEVELLESASLHRADPRLLDCNRLRYGGLVRQAERYWRGVPEGVPGAEILFRGRYRLVRVVKAKAG